MKAEIQLHNHTLWEPLPRRIGIFRALQLGDLLCSVPALRTLRRAFPEAHISLIGLPWAANFKNRFNNYIDEFIEFPGAPGLPERTATSEEIKTFFDQIKNNSFDVLIQMHGSGVQTNALIQAMGARKTAGFFLPGKSCPNPERFVAYPDGKSEVHRLLELMTFLGLPEQGDYLEFPLTNKDVDDYIQQLSMLPKNLSNYVCIHPGARSPTRRWPPEKFAAVGDALVREGYTVVLTGMNNEQEITGAVKKKMKQKCIDATADCSLGALGLLLRNAKLLICNDTGVSHMAAALNISSVVIFMASDPERWAPTNKTKHRIVAHSVQCRPCDYQHCPTEHLCAHGVTPELVLVQARMLLKRDVTVTKLNSEKVS